MAKATKNIQTTVEVTGVTLELTRSEAEALAAVLFRVGGQPNVEPCNPLSPLAARGDCDSINSALSRVGFDGYNTRNDPRYKSEGSIIFGRFAS